MRASSLHVQGRASTNPGLASRTAAGGAASGGCSLWLLSLAKQEKVTRALDTRGKVNGRAIRFQKRRLRGIPAVWIPAFPAGMTSKSKASASAIGNQWYESGIIQNPIEFQHKT